MKSAVLAFEHSLGELVNNTCAQGHTNFYTLPLLYAYDVFVENNVVGKDVVERWDEMWKRVNTSHYVNLYPFIFYFI